MEYKKLKDEGVDLFILPFLQHKEIGKYWVILIYKCRTNIKYYYRCITTIPYNM